MSIPNLSSLYISILNMRLGKEIIGFDKDALEVFQNYSWPHNFDQFMRILEELVSGCSSPYIDLELVKKFLKREFTLLYMQPAKTNSEITLKGTLSDINQQVVMQVLLEENGKQSATAKRLGISRTTLWRKLQRENEF